MSNLLAITSSSLNNLVEHLAADLRQSAGAPLSLETVVVQSSGMSRWLSIELARLNGICAGMDYRFPNAVIDDIFSQVVPEATGRSLFEPDILSWRIMGVLPDFLDYPEFEPVKNYCKKTVDDRGLLQFSRKVADCFDQYAIYRPDLVLEWDRGEGEGWQPMLWRALSHGYQGQHRAALLNTFRDRITSWTPAAHSGLPDTIRLFGVSYLPVFHLEVLSLLSLKSRIVIYLLNPCGEFWGDIVSRKRLSSFVLQSKLASEEAQEYYETGNPLLSSLGTMGQEFLNLLLDYGASCESLDDSIQSRPADSLLKLVQSDILQMSDRGSRYGQKTEIAHTDLSVQVHSCHGPLREMQVLYDHLLQMFDQLNDLEPRQIIVMTPDIETYAPYISAVFGTKISDRPEIPFTIADRSQRNENPDVAAFLKILKIPNGRFGINQIMDLLESGSVMHHFDISAAEIDTIRDWLTATQVRWGVDAAYRQNLGFPDYDENSWQPAIDRLLLGYALPPVEERLFNGILPYAGIEGRKASALGKLVAFFNQIKASAALLKAARSLSEWADTLTSVVDKLIGTTDNLKSVFETLQCLRDQQELSGFNGSITLDALLSILTAQFDKPGASFGFMSGKVTFCAMLPMRSIPFRVICLVGMNDSVFPRVSRMPGFSIMNGRRLRGDRSLRDEDRYLFLEALMSAEERILISYNGQSNRDNSEIPPSVVVSELIDYIDSGFKPAGNSGSILTQILVRHRLQSFSPAYFNPEQSAPWFSYSRTECQALESRTNSALTSLPFCSVPMNEPDTDSKNVELQNLIRFFHNPAAFFLSLRLGVRPGQLNAELEERESFQLDSLTKYSLKQEMVRLSLEGRQYEDLYLSSRASSILPPMAVGRLAFDMAASEAKIFANRISPLLGELIAPLSFSLQLDDFTLSGRINDIRSDRLVKYRCANIRGKDRISIWIEHLVLNIAAESGYPRQSMLIGRDTALTLPPLGNAAEILHDLLKIYAEGLTRPLPFFPESSFMMYSKGTSEAERCWAGNDFNNIRGESDNPAYNICYGRHNPLDEEFRQLAGLIYAPMHEAAKTCDI